MPLIKPKNGFGGIGGDYIKPTALANVRKFYELLRDDIAIIWCGGVKSGAEALEHMVCGASAVQIGTQLMREGVACFDRIAQELKVLMQETVASWPYAPKSAYQNHEGNRALLTFETQLQPRGW